MALTPLSDALAQLLSQAPKPPDIEQVSLSDALGRVLAEPLLAAVDVPPFDNSAMDGYALRAADIPGEVPVSQRIPAGAPAAPLEAGTAARIFTGAMLPEGADTVVMQEDAVSQNGTVAILGCPTRGSHIRRRGADVRVGEPVLPAGRRLMPQDLGLAASVGSSSLSVYRRLKVVVMTTGDELVSPGEPLQPCQIFNSNAPQLVAQLALLGVEPVAWPSLPDDPRIIGDALERAAEIADCIITSGGVSVGEEDHVRDQIEARGHLALWKLALKPGKPLAFGAVNGCPVFGLPGNPVSAWTTFGLVVKPWLLKAQGATPTEQPRLRVRADFCVDRPGTREEYLRVVLERAEGSDASADWRARLTGDQSSGVLSSAGKADALAVIPIGATVEPGDWLEVILVSDFLH